MPRRPIPPDLLPAEFLTTSRLVHRLYLDPLLCLTPPRPWAPLTDAEWAALAPCLAALGCGLGEGSRPGRPMADPRARLDAIFRAVTLKHRGGRAPWRLLPEALGKADTISRTHRRWGRQGCGGGCWWWSARRDARRCWPGSGTGSAAPSGGGSGRPALPA